MFAITSTTKAMGTTLMNLLQDAFMNLTDTWGLLLRFGGVARETAIALCCNY